MEDNQIYKNILLIFNKDIIYEPIIYTTFRKYPILFNILEAKIYPRHEGRLILQIKGKEAELNQVIEYFESNKVIVEILASRIKKDAEKCVHCGACTGVCKTDALWIDRKTMEVMLTPENCVTCGQCEMACPFDAITMASIDMDI
jgi:L-aspartate semialdehyde sulfurtransferase ferredoxin